MFFFLYLYHVSFVFWFPLSLHIRQHCEQGWGPQKYLSLSFYYGEFLANHIAQICDLRQYIHYTKKLRIFNILNFFM